MQTLNRALMRFKEGLSDPLFPSKQIIQDGAIQRFEFCFELCWKTLKLFLQKQGIESSGPREVLQKAFQINLITEEGTWLQMLQDRNLMSHVYDATEALVIVGRLEGFLQAMQELLTTLEKYK
jgi:nucleotidyltransferase substrate binding protein (TIGR01987 family)